MGVFHSRLTEEQIRMLEHAQAVSLRVILDSEYESYSMALEKCSLSPLFQRREARIDTFCDRVLRHPLHKNMFPISDKFKSNLHNIRKPEIFKVNPSRTEVYKRSFIPYAQRRLNERYCQS